MTDNSSASTPADPSAAGAAPNHTPPLSALWYQPLSLGFVALAASAALALGHRATAPAIAAAEARDAAASLAQVLPAAFADNDLLADTVEIAASDGTALTVHRARRDGQVVAVLYQMEAKGYAGPIRLVMGIDRDGRVLGVRITRHTETPGLGDKIEIRRAPWVLGFDGKSLAEPAPSRWAVRKDGGDFDQFAGATVTPRAVVAAVKQGLERFAKERHAMLGDDALPSAPGAPAPAPTTQEPAE